MRGVSYLMSINRVTITGNLTRDPELRMTTNGTQVMNFGVAVNDRRRNQQTNEWEDRPNFIDCVIFGQRAESLSRILQKGFKVAIEGKLRQNTWESDGQRRSRIEVVVDDLDFMSRRDNQGGGQGGYQNRSGGYGNGGGYQGGGYQGGYNQGGYQNQQPAPAPSYSAPAPSPATGGDSGAPMPPEGNVYDEDIPF